MHTEDILVFMNEQLHHERDLHLCYECFLMQIITMCIISDSFHVYKVIHVYYNTQDTIENKLCNIC